MIAFLDEVAFAEHHRIDDAGDLGPDAHRLERFNVPDRANLDGNIALLDGGCGDRNRPTLTTTASSSPPPAAPTVRRRRIGTTTRRGTGNQRKRDKENEGKTWSHHLQVAYKDPCHGIYTDDAQLPLPYDILTIRRRLIRI
jgi:hypothetical protein